MALWLQVLMLAMPWLGAAYVIGGVVDCGALRLGAGIPLFATLVVLWLMWRASQHEGHLHKF